MTFFKFKKYYEYDDIEYKRIRGIVNLCNRVPLNGFAFSQSTDEDYYKPIKSNSAFDGNYLECQSKRDKDKNSSSKEYLYMIITHLRDIISNHKANRKLKVHSSNDYETEGEWKIQLSMKINFVSSKDFGEIHIMHTKNDDTDVLMGSETNDIVKEHFQSLLQKYQEELEETMRGSEFIFDSVNLLYYHIRKISLKRGRSYQKNNDNNCFQYALTVA